MEYIAYLYKITWDGDNEEDLIYVDQTGIDENNMELAKDLFVEFGHDLAGHVIEIVPCNE